MQKAHPLGLLRWKNVALSSDGIEGGAERSVHGCRGVEEGGMKEGGAGEGGVLTEKVERCP